MTSLALLSVVAARDLWRTPHVGRVSRLEHAEVYHQTAENHSDLPDPDFVHGAYVFLFQWVALISDKSAEATTLDRGWVLIELARRRGTFSGKVVSKPCELRKYGLTSVAGVESIILPLELDFPSSEAKASGDPDVDGPLSQPASAQGAVAP